MQQQRWASPPAKRPSNLTPITKSFDTRYSLQLRISDRIEEESSPKKLFTRRVVPCVQELQNIVNDCNSFRRNTRLINKRISLGERRIQKREQKLRDFIEETGNYHLRELEMPPL